MSYNEIVPHIEEHDFQKSINNLKEYTKQIDNSVKLIKVSEKGGLFSWFPHKVTGEEFNKLTSEIQSYFINNNKINSNLLVEFKEVYNALEALDRNYIKAIMLSFKAIEKTHKDIEKNQENIKILVNNQEQYIKVLKKFKEDVEKLQHFMDIDKVWDILDEQVIISEKLKNDFDNFLEDIKNLTIKLKDIDNKYNIFENNIKRDQEECLNKVNSKLEENDIFIRDFVRKTNKKVKIFCLISGFSIAISVVQLLLNIFKIL